ncbi:MAG: hypothetical protein HY691_03740 [Chloroflexi bacterium]|nr:hypothetical protein [Chloroflexota bacterium]
MELVLQPAEAEVLKRVLASYLSDLRMEIASTDKLEWRQALKADEVVLTALIARLTEAGIA